MAWEATLETIRQRDARNALKKERVQGLFDRLSGMGMDVFKTLNANKLAREMPAIQEQAAWDTDKQRIRAEHENKLIEMAKAAGLDAEASGQDYSQSLNLLREEYFLRAGAAEKAQDYAKEIQKLDSWFSEQLENLRSGNEMDLTAYRYDREAAEGKLERGSREGMNAADIEARALTGKNAGNLLENWRAAIDSIAQDHGDWIDATTGVVKPESLEQFKTAIRAYLETTTDDTVDLAKYDKLIGMWGGGTGQAQDNGPVSPSPSTAGGGLEPKPGSINPQLTQDVVDSYLNLGRPRTSPNVNTAEKTAYDTIWAMIDKINAIPNKTEADKQSIWEMNNQLRAMEKSPSSDLSGVQSVLEKYKYLLAQPAPVNQKTGAQLLRLPAGY